MKLHSLSVRGVGRLHDDVVLPVADLGDAEVVAIVGKNGAGKTTLIECLPGSLYGYVPSHGKLVGMANAKASMVETQIETDQVYTLRWLIDAVRKTPKTEAYLFDAGGVPLTDGKQGTFLAEVARRFPSDRVYLASGFAAQTKAGQFLEVAKADRKALFAEMLGLGYLQRISDTAGERAKRVEATLATLRGKAAAHHEVMVDLDHARKRFVHQLGVVADLRREVDIAAAEYELADGVHTRWVEARQSLAVALTDAGHRLDLAKAEAETRTKTWARISYDIEHEESRQHTWVEALSREPDLIIAAEPEEAIKAEVNLVQMEIDDLRSQAHNEMAAQRDHAQALANAKGHARTVRREHELNVDYARRTLDAAALTLRSMESDAAGLTRVPCHGEGEFSTCPLITKATTASQSLDWQRKHVAALRTKLSTAAVEGKALQDADAKVASLVNAAPPREGPPDTTTLEARLRDLRSKAGEAAVARLRLAGFGDTRKHLAESKAEVARMKGLWSEAGTHVAEAKKTTYAARQRVDEAKRALSEHDVNQPSLPDKGRTQLAMKLAESALTDAAIAQETLERATDASVALHDIEAEIATATVELDEWVTLQRAFGPDGIQALEIDAAGPEVSELINDLLHSCYGSRFACALETTAQKKTGGTKEIFDLRVIDTEMGRDGSASDLSGGERVIVAEALSLAIAIYNARRSDIPILDLWRDECSGALHPDAAPLYVAMLRQAISAGGFHRVYFVAHQRELWDLADARLVVEDGRCHADV